MKNTSGLLTAIAGFSIFLLNPSHADARIWKDISGSHSVDAEFASLDGDSVRLKTPSGKLITLSLAKLSLEDQAFVKKLTSLTPDAGVPASADGVNVTVKMNLVEGMAFTNNAQRKIFKLHMDVTAVGGIAAKAYAVGPISVEPLTLDGKTLKPDTFMGGNGFQVINRSESNRLNKQPENGIHAELSFGEVPESTKAIGPVKGSVKVMTGGTEKTVVIDSLLTRPNGILNDPALKAAGLEMKLTRMAVGGNTQLGIEMNQKSAAAFTALELYAADGHEMGANDLSNSASNGIVTYYKSEPAADMKGATLKLKFREGGKEIDIPFNIPQVTIDQ